MSSADKPDEILGYLASLPDAEPSAGLRDRVHAATRSRRGHVRLAGSAPVARVSARRKRRWLFATAASAFVLAGVAGSLHLWSGPNTVSAPETTQTSASPGDPESIHAEIRALDRRLQRLLADEASDEELRSLWRERAVLAELLDQPDAYYQPTRI